MKLNKAYTLVTGLYFLFFAPAMAQNVFQKTYGGTNVDYGDYIKVTSDGGFVVTGTTASYGTLNNGVGFDNPRDLYIAKADLLGITTWSKEAGVISIREEGKIVKPLAAGGYIVGGRLWENATDGNDSWVLKRLDNTGNPVTERSFGKTGAIAPTGSGSWDDELFAIDETAIPLYAPGNVTMVGFAMNYRKPGKRDIGFVIYNSNLPSPAVSVSRFIGTDTSLAGTESGKDFVYESGSVTHTILGESNKINPANGQDIVIFKLTSIFGMGIQRSFGGTGTEEARTVLKTSDGGYFIFGTTNSTGVAGANDFLAIKTDVNFNLTWAKVIGGAADDIGYQAKQTSDGGYILIGETRSFNTYSAGGKDMFVVKLTNAGALSWAKVYGGSGDDDGRSVDIRSDGGFFFTGSCNPPISIAGNGQDIYVVATSSTGYSGGCNEASVTPTVNNITLTSVSSGLQISTPAMDMQTPSLVNTSATPPLSCKCSQFAPNKEIMGATQVCHNTSGAYYINKLPGHNLYSWTLTGATFASAPGASDTLVNLNFTNTNATLIVATNDGNCSDFKIDTITISIDNINTHITTPDSLLCTGDATTLTAVTGSNQGAITSWVWTPTGPNNAVNNVSPSGTTTYSVTVTDSWTCTATDTIRVTVFTYPVVNIGPNDTVCNGGPVLLNATTAGSTYLWNTSANTPTINAITSGTYWVDVTRNGCTTRDSIILGISTNPTITINGDDSLCIGDATTLTAVPSGGNGSYTFLWSGGLGTSNTITQSPIANTTYTVTVTEGFGCTNSATQLVRVFSYPVVSLGPDSGVCNGVVPFVTLDAQNPGSTYAWSTTDATQTLNVTTSGIYWVDVTNPGGCTSRDSVTITFSTNPVAAIIGDLDICVGSSTTIVGNAGGGTSPYVYTWSAGPVTADSITVTPISTTNYNVVASDQAGCKDTAFFTVIVRNYPVVNIGPDTTGCFNNLVVLNAPATTGTILWSTGSSQDSITASPAGTYWLDITENGCTTRDSALVSYYPIPSVNLGTDSTMCVIGTVTLDATNVYSTYLWSTSATTPSINVNQTGLYWVQVTSCGVTYSDSIAVVMDTFSVHTTLVVPEDCGSSNGAITVASTSIYPTTWVWTSGTTGTNPAITGLAAGTYVVQATDSTGCQKTLAVDLICNIPNVIVTQLVTPNGDGKNDTWIIQGIINFPNLAVKVYNRWGNEVYSSVHYNNDWDGKSNSDISLGNDYLPAGTYFYVVDVKGNGDKADILSGYLELQR